MDMKYEVELIENEMLILVFMNMLLLDFLCSRYLIQKKHDVINSLIPQNKWQKERWEEEPLKYYI